MNARLDLEIESIAAGGDGVARHDGLVVFVPRTAPGDRVSAQVEQRGRLARGIVLEVERAGPSRVEAPCPHYVADRCGGCQLQHLELDAQRVVKQRIIVDAFRRIARRDVALPPVRTGGAPWRYRRKLTLALRRERGTWIAGLHAFDAADRVFPLVDCLIADERLIVVWQSVLRAANHLPAVNQLRGAVRLLDGARTAVAFTLEGANAWATHAEFFESARELTAVWWTPDGGARRLLHDRREPADRGAPAASFAQVNPGVADDLAALVVALTQEQAPTVVVDAYSGAGDVASALFLRGIRVTALELDPDASAWCAGRLGPGSRAVTGRVEDTLDGALPADVVILNPPRTGVAARVASRLDRSSADGVRAIIYVSCDPATLARDVARLPSWRVTGLTAFDMFPQTAHVEMVCELVPANAA